MSRKQEKETVGHDDKRKSRKQFPSLHFTASLCHSVHASLFHHCSSCLLLLPSATYLLKSCV